jgi:hypothetical protein
MIENYPLLQERSDWEAGRGESTVTQDAMQHACKAAR